MSRKRKLRSNSVCLYIRGRFVSSMHGVKIKHIAQPLISCMLAALAVKTGKRKYRCCFTLL